MESEYLPVQKPRIRSNDPAEHSFALALKNYTDKKSTAYDADFDVEIRTLQPGWFKIRRGAAETARRKEELLIYAKSGAPRPSSGANSPIKKELGVSMMEFVTGKENLNKEYSKKIRGIRPDWFVDVVAENKKLLIELAKSGADRPSKNDRKDARLAGALAGYTNAASNMYDAEFAKLIKQSRPDWFVRERVAAHRQQVIDLAKSGGAKPSGTSEDEKERKLYACLIKGLRDHNFSELIRNIRPDWFVDIVAENKIKLITLAKSGARRPGRYINRPSEEQRLATAFNTYTYKKKTKMYDPVFEQTIRELRPDWFIRQSEINKQKLIELAHNGAARPKQTRTNNSIGRALVRYTDPCGDQYQPKFDKLIRSLRPNWFITTTIENKSELLRLASSGMRRPIRSINSTIAEKKLASRLWAYTTCGQATYDCDFDKTIRSLRPDWFQMD
jgi:hypothetical protein